MPQPPSEKTKSGMCAEEAPHIMCREKRREVQLVGGLAVHARSRLAAGSRVLAVTRTCRQTPLPLIAMSLSLVAAILRGALGISQQSFSVLCSTNGLDLTVTAVLHSWSPGP